MPFPFIILFPLCLIIISVTGIFHFYIFDFERYVSFYISISFFFIFFISFLFISKFVFDTNVNFVKKYIKAFTNQVVRIDRNFISFEELSALQADFLDLLSCTIENNKHLFCRLFPWGLSFTTSFCLLFVCNIELSVFIVVFILIIHVIFLFSNLLIRIFDNTDLNSNIEILSQVSLSTARGIQFFNIQEKFLSRINQKTTRFFQKIEHIISNKIWQIFFLGCVTFCLIVLAYVFIENSYSQIFFDGLQKYNLLISFCLWSYVLTMRNFWKVRKPSALIMQMDELLKGIPILNISSEQNNLNQTKNLFIAFHGICFCKDGIDILRNLTFSVLPGEFVAVTGENIQDSSYIFDLILKFYTPQSGNIYIGGNNISGIQSNNLRLIFSVFKIDFGLIPGSVKENVRISSNESEEKLLAIIEKTGLQEFINDEVIGWNGVISVPQEVLIRLQIARIFMRDYKIILLEEPEVFENAGNEELFIDFIKFISKDKTVIMATKRPAHIIYADKILYINEQNAVFGSHADLSVNEDYCRFLFGLSK